MNHVIYHANCADGFGAAYAAWYAFPKYGFKPMSYDDPFNPDDYTGEGVYILDFSFPKPVMERLFEVAEFVVWIDHHKTAFESWLGFYEPGISYKMETAKQQIYLNDTESGALAAWKYFNPALSPAVPAFILDIDDRDRWQFKRPNTKAFAAGLWARRPWTFEQWNELREPAHYSNVLQTGDILLAQQAQDVAAAARRAMPCSINSQTGVMVNAVTNISELGHHLVEQGAQYALIWYVDKDLSVRCSLRSTGAYDVSAIAKTFGGGGHMNAAGFTTTMPTLMKFMTP